MAETFGTSAGTGAIPISSGVGESAAGDKTGSGAGIAKVPVSAGTGVIGITGTGAGTSVTPKSNANGIIGITGTSEGKASVPIGAGLGSDSSGTSAGVAKVPIGSGTGIVEISGTSAGTAKVPTGNNGRRYKIHVESRPMYCGPKKNSFAEVFDFVGYCEFDDNNTFDVIIKSDYRRHKTEGNYVANETIVNNQDAEGQPQFRQSIVDIPPAGLVGTFFQYEIDKAVPTDGNFKWSGGDINYIPRPQLGPEFFMNTGDIEDGW